MDPHLAGHKRELLTNAARDLNAAQMLRFDERTGNLYVAELGRVASHFYLQYTSVQTYNQLLTKHMSDSEVGPSPSTRRPLSTTSAAPSSARHFEASVSDCCEGILQGLDFLMDLMYVDWPQV